MKFVRRWIGGVIKITTTTSSQYRIDKGIEKNMAPITKSI